MLCASPVTIRTPASTKRAGIEAESTSVTLLSDYLSNNLLSINSVLVV
ncbi:Uncharacterised protein [Mycobacteroides abscessus subsp. abscessus]|nr:Uncharacterised protein [Mycobacteroides abscessus subsp. abscessus]